MEIKALFNKLGRIEQAIVTFIVSIIALSLCLFVYKLIYAIPFAEYSEVIQSSYNFYIILAIIYLFYFVSKILDFIFKKSDLGSNFNQKHFVVSVALYSRAIQHILLLFISAYILTGYLIWFKGTTVLFEMQDWYRDSIFVILFFSVVYWMNSLYLIHKNPNSRDW